MATTILQGRSLNLLIDGDSYNDQASTVTLVRNAERTSYEVLSGTAYHTNLVTAELQVEMYADWGAVGSLCEALWNAADTAPDTALAFSFEANGKTFTGSCFPAFPDAGGADPVTALTVSVTLTVENGDVTLA